VLRGTLVIWETATFDEDWYTAQARAHTYCQYISENGVVDENTSNSPEELRTEKMRRYFAEHPEKSKWPAQQSLKWIK
jgi:hypothetical protein